MQFEIFIPIVFFLCVTYAIKVVVDARVRRRFIESNGSDDIVRAMLAGEEQHRRHGSLRWGVTLVAMALGFGLVEMGGWVDLTPGVLAILLGATGLGNLAYWFIARKQG